MGHSGRSCFSAFISYEGRGILSIWNEFQLWFQIKIRSLFKWYFLICVLCYRSFFVKSYFFICRFCYSFVCVSVFILQVILHLLYKQVICKKKKQKNRKNSIPAVHWGKIGTWKCFSSHENFFFSDKRLCIGEYLCHNTGPLYQRAK